MQPPEDPREEFERRLPDIIAGFERQSEEFRAAFPHAEEMLAAFKSQQEQMRNTPGFDKVLEDFQRYVEAIQDWEKSGKTLPYPSLGESLPSPAPQPHADVPPTTKPKVPSEKSARRKANRLNKSAGRQSVDTRTLPGADPRIDPATGLRWHDEGEAPKPSATGSNDDPPQTLFAWAEQHRVALTFAAIFAGIWFSAAAVRYPGVLFWNLALCISYPIAAGLSLWLVWSALKPRPRLRLTAFILTGRDNDCLPPISGNGCASKRTSRTSSRRS